jgi:hypothetical protein
MHSPSYGSSGSLHWTLVVATMTLGSTSIIRFFPSGFDSESESSFDLETFSSTTSD